MMEGGDENTLEYWKNAFHTMQSEFDELVESSQELEAALENDLVECEARKGQLERDLVQKDEELNNLKSKSTSMNNKIVGLEQQLNELKEGDMDRQKKVRDLETLLDEKEQKIRILEATDKDVQEKLDHVLEQNVFLEEEKEELERNLQRLQVDLDEVKGDLEVQKKQQQSGNDDKEEVWKGKIRELENDRNEILAQFEDLKNTSAKEKEHLESVNREFREELSKKSAEDLNESQQHVEAKLNEMEASRVQLLEELENLKSNFQAKESQLKNSFQEKLSVMESERNQLLAELENLKNTLKEKESELLLKLEKMEKLNTIETERDQLLLDLDNLKKSSKNIESQLELELKTSKEKESQLSLELENLRKNNKESQLLLSELELLKEKTQDAENLKGLNESLTEQLNAEREKNNNNNKVVQQDNEIASSLNDTIKVQTDRIDDLTGELERLKGKLSVYQDQEAKSKFLMEELEELKVASIKPENDIIIANLNDEVSKLKSELENYKTQDFDGIKVKLGRNEKKIIELETKLKDQEMENKKRVDQLNTTIETQAQQIKNLIVDLENKREKLEMIQQSTFEKSGLPNDIVQLRLAYAAQLKTNASLLNRMQKLRGNILVCCRIRPVIGIDNASDMDAEKPIVQALNNEEVSFYNSKSSSWRPFAFDRVFPGNSTQTQVCREISNLGIAESVVGGVNACIMAYGQTGSGKTYTMDGPENDRGINFQAMKQIFELVQLLEKSGQGKYTTSVSMVEIYNERVRDLLADADHNNNNNNISDTQSVASFVSTTSSTITTRSTVTTANKGMMDTKNFCWIDCDSLERVENTLQIGRANRSTAATDLNLHSSRSHLIIIVKVKCSQMSGASTSIDGLVNGDLVVSTGRLFLVDLAGSERVSKSKVEGSRLDETKHINRSLSALGDVMEALDSKNRSRHVPYRNSKLTHLLQPVLGGNARTIMILTVPPSKDHSQETLFSLQFAQRARNIELGPAKRHVQVRNTLADIQVLHERNQKLQSDKSKLELKLSELKRKLRFTEQTLQTIKSESVKKEGVQKKRVEQQQHAREREVLELKKKLSSLRDTLKTTTGKLESEQRKGKITPRKTSMIKQREVDHLKQMNEKQRNEVERLRGIVSAATTTNNRTPNSTPNKSPSATTSTNHHQTSSDFKSKIPKPRFRV